VEGRHEIGGRCGSLSVTATWMMADSIPQPGSPVIWTTSIPICTSTLHVMYVWYWYVVKLCLSFQKKKNFAWLCCSYLNIWSTACISLLCEGQCCTLAFIPWFLLLHQAGCNCIDWRLQMNSSELKEMDSDPTAFPGALSWILIHALSAELSCPQAWAEEVKSILLSTCIANLMLY